MERKFIHATYFYGLISLLTDQKMKKSKFLFVAFKLISPYFEEIAISNFIDERDLIFPLKLILLETRSNYWVPSTFAG